MSARKPLVVGEHLYKVFGRRPQQALKLLDEGLDKDEIFERTGQTVAIDDVNFDVREGEVFVIMGLSGSGKSTLLRMLNRVIEPTAGTVRIGGRDVTRMSKKKLRELRRSDVSMVFQSFALMPHQRVWENAAFGLEVAGLSRSERKTQALAALEQVGLKSHAEAYPSELSGGMQQRVGLARALAAEPTILLMDEAFSALDPLIRASMQDELLALQRRKNLTVVFISHDLDEAMRIGDRIAILESGRVLQVGTPEDILQNPVDDHVRSFFGGVDISNVFTAGDIARPEKVVVTPRGNGLHAALGVLARHEHDYAYVRDHDGKLLGVVSADSVLEARRAGSERIEDAYVEVEPLQEDTSFDDVVDRLSKASFPIPVVDEDGRLKGTISKSRLLQVLGGRGQT